MINDLMEHVDRRAGRALRMEALALRHEEVVTPRDLAAVFAQWMHVLEENLEPPVFFGLIPELRRVTASTGLTLLQQPGGDDSEVSSA